MNLIKLEYIKCLTEISDNDESLSLLSFQPTKKYLALHTSKLCRLQSQWAIEYKEGHNKNLMRHVFVILCT